MFLSPVTELHELIIETSTHAEITLKVFIIVVYSNLTEHTAKIIVTADFTAITVKYSTLRLFLHYQTSATGK